MYPTNHRYYPTNHRYVCSPLTIDTYPTNHRYVHHKPLIRTPQTIDTYPTNLRYVCTHKPLFPHFLALPFLVWTIKLWPQVCRQLGEDDSLIVNGKNIFCVYCVHDLHDEYGVHYYVYHVVHFPFKLSLYNIKNIFALNQAQLSQQNPFGFLIINFLHNFH